MRGFRLWRHVLLTTAAAGLLVAACGRFGFAPGDEPGDGDGVGDEPLPVDAAGAASDAPAPAPDAAPPGPMTVTTTSAAGPGSFAAALDYLNANCAVLGPEARRVTFAIPLDDPGLVTLGAVRVWRIGASATTSIACADAVIDGATQTAFGGDTNPLEIGGMPVGAGGMPLAPIAAPEIELRGIGLTLDADRVVLRGLTLQSVGSNFDGLTVEGCWLGSEPDQLAPLPLDLRSSTNTLLYFADGGDGTSGHMITGNVFVWSPGQSPTYNGLTLGSSGASTIAHNYMVGTGGGGLWDELHLNPAVDVAVQHNYIGGDTWEFHIEWVNGTDGGGVVENTFTASVIDIRVQGGSPPFAGGNIIE